MAENFSAEQEIEKNLFNILSLQAFRYTLSDLDLILSKEMKLNFFGKDDLLSINSNSDEEKVRKILIHL